MVPVIVKTIICIAVYCMFHSACKALPASYMPITVSHDVIYFVQVLVYLQDLQFMQNSGFYTSFILC